MRHELKIRQPYLIRLLTGEKTFEIRKNDRDYQVGDKLKFMPLEDGNCNVYNEHPAPIPEFEITYIHMGFGMEAKHVILAVKAIEL